MIKEIKNKIIFVVILFFIFIGKLSSQVISGLVTDNFYNEPFAGASVIVKGTNIGIVTDINGRYSIKVDSTHKTLCFSYVGFSTEEVEINGKTTINVILKEDPIVLEDIVFVEYKKRKAVPYGIKTTIDKKTGKIITSERTILGNSLRDSIELDSHKIKLIEDRLKFINDSINKDCNSTIQNYLREFLRNEIQYPKEAIEKDVEGKISIMFIIDDEGNLKDVKILRDLYYILNEEVLNALKATPKSILIKFARSQGQTTYIIHFIFRLEDIKLI